MGTLNSTGTLDLSPSALELTKKPTLPASIKVVGLLEPQQQNKLLKAPQDETANNPGTDCAESISWREGLLTQPAIDILQEMENTKKISDLMTRRYQEEKLKRLAQDNANKIFEYLINLEDQSQREASASSARANMFDTDDLTWSE